jgi:hypothetical protein
VSPSNNLFHTSSIVYWQPDSLSYIHSSPVIDSFSNNLFDTGAQRNEKGLGIFIPGDSQPYWNDLSMQIMSCVSALGHRYYDTEVCRDKEIAP